MSNTPMQETSTKQNSDQHSKGLYSATLEPGKNQGLIWTGMLILVWYFGLMGTVFWSSVRLFQSDHDTATMKLSLILGCSVLALFFSPLMIELVLERFKDN